MTPHASTVLWTFNLIFLAVYKIIVGEQMSEPQLEYIRGKLGVLSFPRCFLTRLA